MIKTPTVLILGAGASKPYGFPLGEKLKVDMCKELTDQGQPLFTRMLQTTGRLEEDIKHFANQLWRSEQPSVDAFLERRKEFLDIGKEAISCALVPCEEEKRLFSLTAVVSGRFAANIIDVRFRTQRRHSSGSN